MLKHHPFNETNLILIYTHCILRQFSFVHVSFVGFFLMLFSDKVRHEKLFNILEHLDIDGKDLRAIRNLYWCQSAAIRIGGELSEYKLIKRGVRQGCVMSPDLFNIYSEMILRNLENYPGVKMNGENINNIRYADDTVLIADSEENLQSLLDITIEKSEEMGLTLNVKKTECMVI